MTPDENALLLSAYRAAPTVRNRNRVVVANLGLVAKAANQRAQLSRIPFDDLYSVGCIGLTKAVEGFDLTTGNRFSSYAMTKIRGEMLHYQRDREQPGGIRIPRAWIDRAKKIAAGDYTGIKPSDQTLAAQAVQYRPLASIDAAADEDSPTIQLVAPDTPGTLAVTIEDVLMTLSAPVDESQYFNATTICQRYRRRFVDWHRLPTTQRLIATFENSKKPVVRESHLAAVVTRRGHGAGSWVHRDLAAEFLRWVSPEAAALVCYAYSAAVADRIAS